MPRRQRLHEGLAQPRASARQLDDADIGGGEVFRPAPKEATRLPAWGKQTSRTAALRFGRGATIQLVGKRPWLRSDEQRNPP